MQPPEAIRLEVRDAYPSTQPPEAIRLEVSGDANPSTQATQPPEAIRPKVQSDVEIKGDANPSFERKLPEIKDSDGQQQQQHNIAQGVEQPPSQELSRNLEAPVKAFAIRKHTRATLEKIRKMRDKNKSASHHELTPNYRTLLTEKISSHGPWTVLEGPEAANRLRQMRRLGKEENLILPATLKHSFVLDALDVAHGIPKILPSQAVTLKDTAPRYMADKEKQKSPLWIAIKTDKEHKARRWRRELLQNTTHEHGRTEVWKAFTSLYEGKMTDAHHTSATQVLQALLGFAKSDMEKHAVVGADTRRARRGCLGSNSPTHYQRCRKQIHL
jgi:hypothetical protein